MQFETITPEQMETLRDHKLDFEDYNGWTNYDTWNLNLWITNQEVTYNFCLSLETVENFIYAVFEVIKPYVKDNINYKNVNYVEIFDGLKE